jgi:hypothetical protein
MVVSLNEPCWLPPFDMQMAIRNCSFVANRAGTTGGAVALLDNSQAVVRYGTLRSCSSAHTSRQHFTACEHVGVQEGWQADVAALCCVSCCRN